MRKLVLLMLVLGMTSLADAAIVVKVEVDGVEVTNVGPGDVVTVTIGNDTLASGGTVGLELNVNWAENGSAGVLGTWMLPPSPAATITSDGAFGLDFAFGYGTIGLNVMGDWLWAEFTVPDIQPPGGDIDLTWSGTIFGVTPPNVTLFTGTVPDCLCYGDISGDSLVNTTDMNMLLTKLFEKVGVPAYEHDPVPAGFQCMDLDGNDKLNTTDMNLLLLHLFTYGEGNPGWASPCMPEP